MMDNEGTAAQLRTCRPPEPSSQKIPQCSPIMRIRGARRVPYSFTYKGHNSRDEVSSSPDGTLTSPFLRSRTAASTSGPMQSSAFLTCGTVRADRVQGCRYHCSSSPGAMRVWTVDTALIEEAATLHDRIRASMCRELTLRIDIGKNIWDGGVEAYMSRHQQRTLLQ